MPHLSLNHISVNTRINLKANDAISRVVPTTQNRQCHFACPILRANLDRVEYALILKAKLLYLPFRVDETFKPVNYFRKLHGSFYYEIKF